VRESQLQRYPVECTIFCIRARKRNHDESHSTCILPCQLSLSLRKCKGVRQLTPQIKKMLLLKTTSHSNCLSLKTARSRKIFCISTADESCNAIQNQNLFDLWVDEPRTCADFLPSALRVRVVESSFQWEPVFSENRF
jgi:hypothetical protein